MAARRNLRSRPVPPAEQPVSVGLAPEMSGGSNETTGRMVVIFDEQAAGTEKQMRALLSPAGAASNVATATDFPGEAVPPDVLDQAQAVVFPRLGMAVVSGDSDAGNMMSMLASTEQSPILAVEPEYRVYALQEGNFAAYLSGYKDAVNHLYERFLAGEEVSLEEAPSGGFADTSAATWGLAATRVLTSRYIGAGIRVAVLDTGMDLAHPDFAARAIVSRSFVQAQAVQDGNGHGTRCVGTACGPRAPQTGVRRYGVAYGAAIHVGKVLSNQGGGSTMGILAGIEWALANKCQVISMSLGGNVDQKLQQYEVPLRRALARGSLVIAAAGNNAKRNTGNFGFVSFPANADAAMAVGALDSRLQIANFSARSSTVTGKGGKVNIAAPGVDVVSSVPVRLEPTTP